MRIGNVYNPLHYLKSIVIFYHWQLSIFLNTIHRCPVFERVAHVVSSFAIILERKKVIKIQLNIHIHDIQNCPKITHAQEPQEAARTYEAVMQDGERRCCRSNCLFVYKCHVGGRNAQRLLAVLSVRY